MDDLMFRNREEFMPFHYARKNMTEPNHVRPQSRCYAYQFPVKAYTHEQSGSKLIRNMNPTKIISTILGVLGTVIGLVVACISLVSDFSTPLKVAGGSLGIFFSLYSVVQGVSVDFSIRRIRQEVATSQRSLRELNDAVDNYVKTSRESFNELKKEIDTEIERLRSAFREADEQIVANIDRQAFKYKLSIVMDTFREKHQFEYLEKCQILREVESVPYTEVTVELFDDTNVHQESVFNQHKQDVTFTGPGVVVLDKIFIFAKSLPMGV